jgi:predicted TIM-barrel fold metal-dependent hydrolase
VTETEGRSYVVISSDAHAGANLPDYKSYLERGFHDEFDGWAKEFKDAWADFDTEMTDTDDEFLRVGVASFLSPYNWDNEKRLAHMDAEGIAAEVIFPNTVPPFYPSGVITAPAPSTEDEYRRRWAGVKAHNRWLVDFCAQASGRRAGLAQVFLTSLDDAIAEVRWAKEAGLAGVLIPSDHHLKLVPLYERWLDPFWAVCNELQLPVHRHSISVSAAETPDSGPAAPAIGVHECHVFFRRGLAHLILGGVFQRFPDLKFVLTETNCAWAPMDLYQMDVECRLGAAPGSGAYPYFHRAVQELDLSPSEYFKRNCYLGASQMVRADVEMRHIVGVDRIMWGSDYPHHEGTWPHSRLALRLNFSGVPQEEVRAMTSLNAAGVYGFDLDFLQSVADRIGPTVDEMATPVSPEELPAHSVCITLADAIAPIGPPPWMKGSHLK